MDQVRDDFNRLASFADDGWNHNTHYHDLLLRHVPTPCHAALDLGCGAGLFARKLAERADHVLALDLAPGMIEIAQARSTAYPNITFQAADILTTDLAPESFDCIASIATLHHLPHDTVLRQLKNALRPGGVLLVLDLVENEHPADLWRDLLAIPANAMLRLRRTGHLHESDEVRAAWAAHGAHDSYLTFSEAQRTYHACLPGVQLRHHLLWRYSAIWHK
ncbi:MAG: class I SAM-dependent methyltransferase [Anaerolineae bacterium]|nr:class I SAM-dependent methyltransferase [Anaerolineae bacterium]